MDKLTDGSHHLSTLPPKSTSEAHVKSKKYKAERDKSPRHKLEIMTPIEVTYIFTKKRRPSNTTRTNPKTDYLKRREAIIIYLSWIQIKRNLYVDYNVKFTARKEEFTGFKNKRWIPIYKIRRAVMSIYRRESREVDQVDMRFKIKIRAEPNVIAHTTDNISEDS